MMKNWLLSAGLLAAAMMVVLPVAADSNRTSGDIANAQDLFRRLQDIGRGGRTVYAWSTSCRNWSPEGWRMFKDATGHEPLLYFAEFRDIGGTWYPRERYARNRAAFAETVKRNWRLRRAVPMVTWHIQNPYVPERWTHPRYGNDCGMRYVAYGQDDTGYHKQVLREILDGTGTTCGYGRIDGLSEKTFANPRAWFEWCLRDVAAFCRTLTDDEGRRIPIVFRPFHEMDGGWFWWGKDYASPADVAGAFRLFADIMREELGRENVLMCYSPDKTWSQLGKIGEDGFLTWYPGNDYADLIGWDDYGIGAGATEAERRANALRTLEKMRAVSEFALANDKVCGIWESGNRMFGKNDVDRPGFYRTLHELATAPGVAFSVMTTYDGPCTFPNTDAGKREMAEFLSAPETVIDDWNGKVRFPDAAAYVDPFIGTGGYGHLYPGPKWPNGMVSPGPDTGTGGWSHCAGYQYSDTRVRGFSQIHASGMGAAEFMDVLIQPFTGGAVGAEPDWGLVDKRTERAEPGYYACELTNHEVRVELTTSRRVAYHRYTFTGKRAAHVLVDLAWGARMWGGVWQDKTRPRVLASAAEVSSDGTWVTGQNTTRAFMQKDIAYAVRFSRKPTAWRQLPSRPVDGPGKRYVFDFDLEDGDVLLVKAALSSVDAEAAKANLLADPDGFDFDARRTDCAAAWNDILTRAVPEGDARTCRIFLTSLYHAFLEPSLFCDVDRRFRGADGKVRRAEGYEKYTMFSLWDTYRAQCPLFSVLRPELVRNLALSMLGEYDEIGRVPRHQTWGQEVYCMVGDHSIPFLVDSYLKGFLPDVDPKRLMNALDATARPRKGRYRDFDYDKIGYFPIGAHGSPCSHSLEFCLDDACVAMLARRLGDAERAAFYGRRAQFYRKLYDSASGCFRARYENGDWRTPFDPLKYGAGGSNPNFDYTESCALNYAWHQVHDPEGLIELHGGRERCLADLERLFRKDEGWATRKRDGDCTGLIGEYAQGNEPQHHIAYYYQFLGRGDRTAEVVREICERLYTDDPRGVCGNDDCGQMSAWYVFSAMGFYPFMPCGGEYVVGAPQLRKVTARIGGKTLTIRADGISPAAKYVKSIVLNGRPLDGFKLTHGQLAAGGELVFEMSEQDK